ncbi:hypothetical protein B566_EDAN004826 [Ephemera danica]|nr:hypothetical protein B566_EDAN004826 [Ephemera danica]
MVCGCSVKNWIFFSSVVLAIAYLPGLPPHVKFTPYSVTPPRELTGVLKVNEKLNGGEKFLLGQLKNPGGVAVANGTLYTGIQGGNVIKIIEDKIVPVVNLAHPCGKVMHLINTKNPIEGKSAMVTNGVTVGSDGSVYWTVSSCEDLFDHSFPTSFSDPSGRVFKYDPIKKTNTLLIDKMHFPVGIILSTKEDFIVVAETLSSRLSRYWLSGSKKGKTEVLTDGLPGLPDGLRPNGKGGFFVTTVLPRTPSVPSPTDILGPYPTIRRFLARLCYLIEAPFSMIHQAYPNFYTGMIIHWMFNIELLSPLVPQGLIVVEVNESGDIIGSLQSTDNQVTTASDFVQVENYFYFSSPANNYLGRVKIS